MAAIPYSCLDIKPQQTIYLHYAGNGFIMNTSVAEPEPMQPILAYRVWDHQKHNTIDFSY